MQYTYIITVGTRKSNRGKLLLVRREIDLFKKCGQANKTILKELDGEDFAQKVVSYMVRIHRNARPNVQPATFCEWTNEDKEWNMRILDCFTQVMGQIEKRIPEVA